LYQPAFADNYIISIISQDFAWSRIFDPNLGSIIKRHQAPGGVIPFADCAIQLADEMNSRLGSIRHNSPRTSALRRDKYLQQAQYGMKDVVTKTEIEETDRN